MKGAAVLALVLGFSAPACGGGAAKETTGSAGRLAVVASFYPVFEAASRVGGDRVEVTNLTPAGTEPHDLELNPDQVDSVEDADLLLFLGQGFQPAIEKVGRRLKGTAVDLLDGLPLVEGEIEGERGTDPHVWLDPVLMQRMVERIQQALTGADPGGKAAYRTAADAFLADLGRLDQQYRTRLGTCARKVVVTAHDAFGYLTRRYGLSQQAIAGFSPEAEPDPQHLAELADFVRASGATTVFTETLVSPRIAETLAREAGVGTAVLNPLEGLTPDEVEAGGTYLSVMGDNLGTLATALSCG